MKKNVFGSIRSFLEAVKYVQKWGPAGISRDPLTGLFTRGWFEQEIAPREIERARRYKRHFTVVFLDLDGLKGVNDKRGHSAGDAILQEFACDLLECCRPGDFPVRLGGDEFLLFLPETTESKAKALVNRIRDHAGSQVQFSVGIESWCPRWHNDPKKAEPPVDLAALVSRADKKMYQDKRRRRQEHPVFPIPQAVGG